MLDTYHHKPKSLWMVRWGKNYTEGVIICVTRTKKKAVELIKSDGGFRLNSSSGLWENKKLCEWYSIDTIDFIE